ncbi:hypothetical protein HY008_00400 [Candidatus Woesebacteria bacterium]|nr:hypothetical protein [Candidatus Woesebacteria bacterium]
MKKLLISLLSLFSLSIFFFTLTLLFPIKVNAQCNSSTVDTCGVCPDPQQRCVFDAVSGFHCAFITGQCGFTGSTCSSATANRCDVCPSPQQCAFDAVSGFHCKLVAGQCGFSGCPTPIPGPPGSCDQVGRGCCAGGAGKYCNNGLTCDSCDICRGTALTSPVPTAPPPPLFCLSQLGGISTTPTNYLYTAIGCIQYSDAFSVAAFLLRWGIGIAGGIALLFIVYGGFLVMSSSGDPARLKAGQELISSAIMGLILIIFSVIILRTIGVTILRIPGM